MPKYKLVELLWVDFISPLFSDYDKDEDQADEGLPSENLDHIYQDHYEGGILQIAKEYVYFWLLLCLYFIMLIRFEEGSKHYWATEIETSASNNK